MTTRPERRTRAASDPSGPGASLGRWFNATNLRHDAWNRLRHGAERLMRGVNARTAEEVRADVAEAFTMLEPIELYWAFPGKHVLAELRRRWKADDHEAVAGNAERVVRLLASDAYRRRDTTGRSTQPEPESRAARTDRLAIGLPAESRPYFEVLVVGELTTAEEAEVRAGLLDLRRDEDEFVYDVLVVPSLEDALIAVLINYNVQACVLRYQFPLRSARRLEILQSYLAALGPHELGERFEGGELALGRLFRELRPELDLFRVTDEPVEDIAGRTKMAFNRIFYRQEDYPELHLSILKGVGERYRTPFFNALRSYSQKPTGVFHAMPLSRGKSIARSHWIQDMGRFYGANIFLAETSATTGGLDSLLQPQGPLKEAQELAARAFGARKTFFVTNGTSSANKIVSHALVRPGDIVLVARDCHKSHHYAIQLSGAHAVYMDPFPLNEVSMYGAVPLFEIKRHLLELERAGKLDRVRMLMLTNCTFDGLTYHPERVMEEVLAIKPDMIFLWDEAWFAFATFHPTLRRRTAMATARRLRERFKSDEYRERYAAWRERFEREGGATLERRLSERLLPDPERARVRVYATQSTHKTLTSLRQGSMIHVHDQDYEQHVSEAFTSAYMTYTSTSPNYQILASLDVGRRQVELEGYELVQRSMEIATILRRKINSHPVLAKYFQVLGPAELIPADHRPSGLAEYYDPEGGWASMESAWENDEIVLDPTRLTLHVGVTGMDGDTFKKHLIDEYDIQINKTSRNTILLMIHIGTTRGAAAHLIEVLCRIAEELDERLEDQNEQDRKIHQAKVRSLTEDLPPLPDFSRFHDRFRDAASTTPEGDMRAASFLAYDTEACEYLPLDGTLLSEMERGREVVSAGFVTPYPPGFPVLVPGQVISREILAYLKALDVQEIHGYRPEYGIRVFTEEVLDVSSSEGGAQ
ncbi:MAG TPA: ornithine decarboxylase [Thermoanaerobaculia bacterium]|nr:ornithine decarboxylase [Thermoanaerobaculia bacterium]